MQVPVSEAEIRNELGTCQCGGCRKAQTTELLVSQTDDCFYFGACDEHAVTVADTKRVVGTYTVGEITKTAALRRLRALAAEGRRLCHLPKNCSVEVGLRTSPLATADPSQCSYLTAANDDLADFRALPWAAESEDVRRRGALVHLYLSERSGYGELTDVCIGWMGHGDQPPRIVNVNGVRR